MSIREDEGGGVKRRREAHRKGFLRRAKEWPVREKNEAFVPKLNERMHNLCAQLMAFVSTLRVSRRLADCGMPANFKDCHVQ